MAEKRCISKVISISKKVNKKLNSHFARLLYTWMIPHADDFGRLTGCPDKVKALIIPMLDESEEEVESAIANMSDAGLIIWYESDEDLYIQIVNFEEHQSGLHKRTKSKFPEPPEHSRKFPEIPLEVKRTEEKRKEEKIEEKGNERENHSGIHSTFNDPIKDELHDLCVKSKLKGYNLVSADELFFFIGKMDIELIQSAIGKAYEKHLNYAVKLLNDWLREGKTKKEDIQPVRRNVRQFPRHAKPQMTISAPIAEPLTPEEVKQLRQKALQRDTRQTIP